MTYAAISADPPWKADDEGIRGGTKDHYETLSLEKIMAMPVAGVAAADAYLFLWIPNFLLIEGIGARVCRAWGFEPKQMGTWVKPHIGTGHNLRNRTESYLVAKRGRPRRRSASIPNFHYWPKAYGNKRRHSEKPPEFYRHVVEKLAGGPYLELFARDARSGWSVWGDQCPGRADLPGLDAWSRSAAAAA